MQSQYQKLDREFTFAEQVSFISFSIQSFLANILGLGPKSFTVGRAVNAPGKARHAELWIRFRTAQKKKDHERTLAFIGKRIDAKGLSVKAEKHTPKSINYILT